MALVLNNRSEYKQDREDGGSSRQPDKFSVESTPLLHSNRGSNSDGGRTRSGRRHKHDQTRRRRVAVCLILAEMFERVAYYGLILNFVLFLRITLYWTAVWSVCGALFFTGSAWVMTVIFGLLADSYFGKKTIICFGYLVYITSAICLPVIVSWVWHEDNSQDLKCADGVCTLHPHPYPINPWLVIITLTLSIGEGCLKANLSSFSSQQFKDKPAFGRARTLFNCFYWGTNAFALGLLLGIVYIQQMSGFVWGFICPAVSLGLSFLCFVVSRHDYIASHPTGTGLNKAWLIIKESVKLSGSHTSYHYTSFYSSGVESDTLEQRPRKNWLDIAAISYGGRFPDSEVEGVQRLCHVLMVFLGLIPYWMLNAQMQTTFIIQGLHMQFDLGENFIIPSAWLCLYEVALLLLIIPFLDKAVYPCLNFCGCSCAKVWRIPLGMLFATLAMVAAGFIDYQKTLLLKENGTINQTINGDNDIFVGVKEQYIFWQIPQFTLMGISEAFASINGLEFAFTYCPSGLDQLHNSISAFFNLTIGLGHFLAIAVLAVTCYLGFYTPSSHEDTYILNDKIVYYFFCLAGLSCLNIFFFFAFLCGNHLSNPENEYIITRNEETEIIDEQKL